MLIILISCAVNCTLKTYQRFIYLEFGPNLLSTAIRYKVNFALKQAIKALDEVGG